MNTNPQGGSRPTVVLVHGAFADGSSWNEVIKRHPGCRPSGEWVNCTDYRHMPYSSATEGAAVRALGA